MDDDIYEGEPVTDPGLLRHINRWYRKVGLPVGDADPERESGREAGTLRVRSRGNMRPLLRR